MPEPGEATGAVAGVVLAAGASIRAGDRNKLLLAVDGRAMVAHAVAAALDGGLDPVVVVTGHDAGAVRGALEGLPVAFAHNPEPETGIAGSLVRGVRALPPDAAGVVVLLGDMPWVRGRHVAALVRGFEPARARGVCVPTCRGRRGNPVLWGAGHFPGLARLTGDVGARHLLEGVADDVHEVEVGDEAVLRDVDTLAAWRAAEGAPEPG